MLKLRAFIVFALVFAGLQVRNVSAFSVPDNFGAGETYDTTGGWLVSDTFADAMPFTAGGNYSSVVAKLAVGLIGGTNSITVALDYDASGAPGATIESTQLNNEMGTFGSANAFLYVDFAPSAPLNSGDTYWLAVSATGDTQASWNYNTTGDLEAAQQLGGGSWTITHDSDTPTGAFSITGAETTAVPEPASIALFGVGTLAAIGFHLARKRRSAKRPD